MAEAVLLHRVMYGIPCFAIQEGTALGQLQGENASLQRRLAALEEVRRAPWELASGDQNNQPP